MPQRIQAPDGSIVEFPDGMNDEQMSAVMSREYAPKKTSQGLGFMQGVTKAFDGIPDDPVTMGLDALGRAVGLDPSRGRRENRQNLQRYYDKREQTQRPGTVGRIAGEIVGTLPVAAVVRNPFAAGAVSSGMLSDAKDAGGLARDMVVGGALGWAGGKVADKAADLLKPAVSPAVKRLSAAGVQMTPGMVKGGKAMVREDRAMSRPIVGDAIAAGRQRAGETFNVASVNEALKPLGKQVPKNVQAGHDAIAFAKTQVDAAYNRVVPNLAVRLDGQKFAQAIAPAAQNLPKAQQAQLKQIVSANLKTGQLAGQPLKAAQGEIRRLASTYRRSQVAAEQELGRALGAVDDELTAAMMAQNPKWAPELQKANAAYRGYRIVADAASRADDGVINTGQLKQAVRRGDFSKSKDATARGEAFMQRFSNDARKVLPSKTPDSGTAGRLQAGNIFANVKGAADRVGYAMDDAMQQFRLAPRPKAAVKAGRVVRRLKPAAGGAAPAVVHGSRE